MLCYAASLKVKQQVNIETITQLVLNWLTSPTKPNGNINKNCFHSLPDTLELGRVYEEGNKSVVMNDYPVRKVYTIHYVFHDLRLDSQFIVDFIFQYSKERRLYLQFSNEIYQDSYYISNVSLPTVFRKIITPEYISNDSTLNMDGNPHFFSNKGFNLLNKNSFKLPIVVMRSNNKHYPYSPSNLSRELLGIGHVICIYNDTRNDSEIEIIYPDHTSVKKEMELKEICETIREYGITHFYSRQFSYFGLLHEARLHESKSFVHDQKEEQLIYQELIQESNHELDELKALKEELEKLKEAKEKEQDSYLMANQMSKAALLKIKDYEHLKEYSKLVFDELSIAGMKTDDKKSFSRWRRQDVIQSILKRNREDKK